MNVTDQAAIELKKIIAEIDNPGAGIHIYSTQGCCGPSIQMDIANQVREKETVVSLNDIDFFIANDLLVTLEKASIDFSPDGFRLEGIEKSGGCGCGCDSGCDTGSGCN